MKRVIILQIVLLASVAAAATDPNLVGWWTFDEGAGTVAYDSAGGNNGNLINGPVWISGYIDGGLSFDGVNDYVDVPDNAALRFTKSDSFSICSWVNPTSGWGEILGKMQSGSQYGLFTYEVQWSSTSQSFDFLLCNSGNYYKYFVTPTDSAPAGIWSHIACVYQNKNVMIYINGELKVSDYFNSDPGGAANNNLAIGVRAYNGAKERYFNGTLDDVRIYNKALSAEEVQQLYKGTTPILTGLEITGPNEVAEKSTAAYKAIAHYDNGTIKDVTALAEWWVEPNNVAGIEIGQLTTGQALYPKQKIKVYAQYTEELTTVDANLPVSVLAICPQGNALMFDGLNDYVELGSPANLDNLPLRDLTISAWIYDKHSAGNTWGTIFGTYMSPNGWAFRTVSNTAGKRTLYLQMPFSGSNSNSWATYQSGYGTILSNTWHHAAAVWNSSTKTAKLYIDGTEPSYQITHPGVGTYNSDASNNKEVGRIPHAGDMQYFNGTIDDVRIYNRALSADEIQTIMHAKPIGSDPNLVAYWDFDEGAGQTAADVSSHGNNGTLGNSAGIDTADPCWVESDAPVGLCTTEQVMLRNLLGATDDKKAANQLIADAKAKERASVRLITELQKQMNSKDQMNAYRAKVQISVAIVQEEMASRQIDATIKRLEEALRLLNYEVDSNSGPTWFPPWHPWPGVNNKTNIPHWPSSYGDKPTGKQSH